MFSSIHHKTWFHLQNELKLLLHVEFLKILATSNLQSLILAGWTGHYFSKLFAGMWITLK